ncbi:MAG TPA: class I lanthipeptide [Thermoanaerobaculia bacterium]|nr:class I lanthipeptide [Thermoanaerobaculia bacterium]
MKKTTPRKMMLNRETLRSLDAATMQEVAGGISGPYTCNASCATDVTCVSCRTRCSAASSCC